MFAFTSIICCFPYRGLLKRGYIYIDVYTYVQGMSNRNWGFGEQDFFFRDTGTEKVKILGSRKYIPGTSSTV